MRHYPRLLTEKVNVNVNIIVYDTYNLSSISENKIFNELKNDLQTNITALNTSKIIFIDGNYINDYELETFNLKTLIFINEPYREPAGRPRHKGRNTPRRPLRSDVL